MPRPLRDQVVVITGASSGIGRETAIEAGRRGASVVLAARNEPALREVAAEVERLGGAAHVARTDVAEWDQVDRLARAAVDRFGRIDTWVNNAAVSAYATVEQMTVEEIERVIQVDLLGQIYGMKAALPPMRRQGGGTIVNVASALPELPTGYTRPLLTRPAQPAPRPPAPAAPRPAASR
jgi:NAD(P)-dependent dehydrogenase (short-subunit alcohol dehydrogenase family)